MLTPEVPSDIHQLHRIKRTSATPRSAGAMSALAVEHVLHRDQSAVVREIAPVHTEVCRHVTEDRDIDILEVAGPNIMSLRPQLLLSNARPDANGTWHLLSLEHALDCKSSSDGER